VPILNPLRYVVALTTVANHSSVCQIEIRLPWRTAHRHALPCGGRPSRCPTSSMWFRDRAESPWQAHGAALDDSLTASRGAAVRSASPVPTPLLSGDASSAHPCFIASHGEHRHGPRVTPSCTAAG
jgi:hypothetical protein